MAEASEETTEERPWIRPSGVSTEPLSQSDIDAWGIRVSEPPTALDDAAVSLDALQIGDHHKQGIRILIRPLTRIPSLSPGSDNCQWLALRADVACSDQPEHKVLAVRQGQNDIKFSIRIPGESSTPPLWCDIYMDPASEMVVLFNKSDLPVSLASVCTLEHASRPPPCVINPGLAKSLSPGTWRILVRDMDSFEFRVLEKHPVTLYQVATDDSPSTASSSGKRSLTPDDDDGDRRAIKRRISDGDVGSADKGVVMFLNPAEPLVFPLSNVSRELSAVHGHALLDAKQGETIVVPGVCEVEAYQLTRGETIASTSLSAVYKATYSKVPGKVVTVKVLKTRVGGSDKPLAHERSVIRQAECWERESSQDLNHSSIVGFYGGDARFLALFMEHIAASDLATPPWRNKTDEFTGSWDDARQILNNIAGALNYIHNRRLVHNDIKPANILYSPERGAVLCDFGLLNSVSNSPNGGTPFYVPPEYIGSKLRGPPSDVWALGVTMLYVLRRIPLPDSRAGRNNPKRLYWLIGGVHNPSLAYKQYGNGQTAAAQMRAWLADVYDAREKLDTRDRLQRIVKEMLVPNPNHRITMAMVLQELQSEQTVAER
ncbi:hypothetical protein XA68_17493 [Ophiocordyceps unilateralis]|uniref:Protein kinase domain-containing protein n=1 Tax=Ophiocordyceps unilateralis TaxID=268505 RepID=A0A2A9PK25_OPHUN|nr:hypothetical protein XA68_17493 [Ophiocordyceps unilateralis]